MHLNICSMGKKKLYTSVVFPFISRHASTTQSTATARSFLVRFIENRRKRSQQDDIRLEPYLSKGVYTESGAIRPVNSLEKYFNQLIFFLDAQTISSWYSESSFYRNSFSLHWLMREQIRCTRSGKNGSIRLQ